MVEENIALILLVRRPVSEINVKLYKSCQHRPYKIMIISVTLNNASVHRRVPVVWWVSGGRLALYVGCSIPAVYSTVTISFLSHHIPTPVTQPHRGTAKQYLFSNYSYCEIMEY